MTPLEISKLLVNNKYRLDCQFDSAVLVVDIPKVANLISSQLQREQQIIDKTKELFLFIETNGKPVDGFRFRDIAMELKALTAE